MHLIFGFDHQSIHVHVLCFGQIKMGEKKWINNNLKNIKTNFITVTPYCLITASDEHAGEVLCLCE